MKIYKISLPVKVQMQKMQKQIHKEAPPCIRMEASYMAEAAVVLPFYAGFMVVLLFFFQVLMVQQNIGNALLATGRELSVLGCAADNREIVDFISAEVLFYKNLKRDSAADSYVQGGKRGISLAQSEFSADYIVLQANYVMRLPIGLFGRQDIPLTQKIKVRKWTGSTDEEADSDEIVYITPKGSVYHKAKDCSYLCPSVEGVGKERISKLRNENGGKYYACTKCMRSGSIQNGVVYITKYGTSYHSQADCSRIKHTVLAVRISEAGDRRACSKCGKE